MTETQPVKQLCVMVKLQRNTLVISRFDNTFLVKIGAGHIEIGFLRASGITEAIILCRRELP